MLEDPSFAFLGQPQQFTFKAQKPWLVAYNELDTSSRPGEQRPRGQPVIFIPADTGGDVILSKVIRVLSTLVSIFMACEEGDGFDLGELDDGTRKSRWLRCYCSKNLFSVMSTRLATQYRRESVSADSRWCSPCTRKKKGAPGERA